ncbi:phosphate ABC transporter permease subunit PstC [Thermocoleostomius sinensis]|jgi:phosphate transport system permease protein|uniref:Phosphate transport system permease protein n=1 Tax=Thermocoleostomius sinensis A174 TaxID=2016057 RepID=A0A9E8ZJF6_9CYAN|nr:phosphate ABC transporter permease subunit PstC [Thermocoleostomius sinensis]WAL59606.1 phosphate ABC transporter permease subunit PstC [Thermocoleostomius sinensis A174]
MVGEARETRLYNRHSIEKEITTERILDQGFVWLTLVMAIGVAAVLAFVIFEIAMSAWPAIQSFGLSFIVTTTWNPVTNVYGALPQIYGTLVTSAIALVIAVPVGIGVAVFLSEDFLPAYIREPIAFAIELIVAIPSVVLGLWGIFVFIPFLRPFYQFLSDTLGWIPLFAGIPRGYSLLTLGIVLSIMIAPLIISVSRGTLASLPPELRQGAMAMGATRWETIFRVLIPAGLSGIIGSIMLALGRAMGETMVAAMLVGNSNRITVSLLEPGATITSLIASQFGEAGRTQVSALLYAGLVLMILTLIVNILAELIIRKFQNIE